jgi:hypothetical protein
MDFLSLLFGFLAVLVLITIFGVNLTQLTGVKGRAEGFEDTSDSLPSVEPKIRAVLDPILAPADGLCDVFSVIRGNMKKNELAGSSLSDAEAEQKVNKTLATSIPGGALPCPLLTYPSSDKVKSNKDWLIWLQTNVPEDFAARIVLMSVYAHQTLKDTVQKLNAALGGAPEGFSDPPPVCPPSLAESRRKEAAQEACVLPEELNDKQIEDSIDAYLKKIIANKNIILKAKSVNPETDIRPLISEAKQFATELKEKEAKVQSGTLINDIKIPSSS